MTTADVDVIDSVGVAVDVVVAVSLLIHLLAIRQQHDKQHHIAATTTADAKHF